LIGGLLGLGSRAAQRKASVVGLSSRPVADKKDKTEARIRELLDQQSSLSIGNASTLAQGALERTAKAELKQAELTASNLELQSKLEGEKAARLTSEAKLLPRTVSVGQAKILKDALAKVFPTLFDD
jgi:hypothetical protein